MGKISKTSNLIISINEIIAQAKEKEIMHIYTEDDAFNGREITLRGKKHLNFGSCGYLGLEFDERIINASIDALKKFGSQYSSSRAYISFTLYRDLEEHLEMIFGAPILLATSSSMGHYAVIPTIIEDDDAIIMDQQAHFSMRDAVDKVKLRGVTVEMVRHSLLDELESKIIALNNKHDKIWYFVDGIYSMYGDPAPVTELIDLLNRHEKLHLYVDDAHGMSWMGKHGSGFVLSKTKLHPKMILTGSLAKSFASAGGVFVFPNAKLRDKVRYWGGPLGYSGPQQPAVIGASLASAKIHLSEEISVHQQSLLHKIKYCNELLKKYQLPHVAESIGPIFYIGLGLTKVGYNMVRRMADDGFYVNLGIFPAVPETCTGIRFTITNHLTYNDIDSLVERIAWHLPKALEEENRSMEDIYRAFRHVNRFKKNSGDLTKKAPYDLKFNLQYETTIKNIPEEVWNSILGNSGLFNWKGLNFLEKVFENNDLPEYNWKFHYYVIRDVFNRIVAATFFTETILKDDMFAPASVSKQIEALRKNNPYYLTSKTFLMGSAISDGDHLYIDKSSTEWKDACMYLLDSVWKHQDEKKCNALYLRDFHANDIELRDFFIENGLIKVSMPDAFIMENFNWRNREGLLASIPSKKRYMLRHEALKYEDCFEVEYPTNASDSEVKHWHKLYLNVHDTHLTLNLFPLPEKFFQEIAKDPNWEVIQVKLKKEFDTREERLPVAVMFTYKTEESYCIVAIGMDYEYVKKFHIYRYIMFLTVLRGGESGKKTIYLAFTADEEKKKYGAKSVPTVAYAQMKDNFNMSVIAQFSNIDPTQK